MFLLCLQIHNGIKRHYYEDDIKPETHLRECSNKVKTKQCGYVENVGLYKDGYCFQGVPIFSYFNNQAILEIFLVKLLMLKL